VHIPNLPQVAGHQLYRAMDELLTVQSELERQVFHSVADLLNLEVDLLYFDTTSSYFEIDPSEAPEEESFRKQGFSRDKRPDLLQIAIGLAVTREGIPIRAWVWLGNTMDMTVIKQVKMVRIVEIRTNESWPKVREECQRLTLGHFSSKYGDLYQRTELTAKQGQTFAALGAGASPEDPRHSSSLLDRRHKYA
jgi:hypothetical protein